MTLELSGVTMTVRDGREDRALLDGIDLVVQAGETVALTGASGSGKSSLLAIAGLLRPATSGRAVIGGTDASDLSDAQRTALRRDRIGIVFQSPNLLPALTALEQVEVVGHVAGRRGAAVRRRAVDLLTRVGLEDRLGSRPAELSGGERQRVGIARALMNEPAVLLADEPTASLDAERGASVMALLLGEVERVGAATLVVTHDTDQAAGAHRWVRLEQGRLAEATRS